MFYIPVGLFYFFKQVDFVFVFTDLANKMVYFQVFSFQFLLHVWPTQKPPEGI